LKAADYEHLILSQPSTFFVFATVSGAHLYGFESPDSDVDLRGMFVLPLDEVIGMQTPNETITRNLDYQGVEIDLVAHDLLKFCRLLTRKNGYVLEQLYSPWVVHGGAEFEELREIAKGCRVKPVYHHYRGFLGTQMKQIAQPEATIKDLLYGYRVALSGIHLMRSGEVEAHLPTLLASYPQAGVAELIARKQGGQEKEPLDPALREFHSQALQTLEVELEKAHESSPLPHTHAPTTLERLNDFVIRVRKRCG
jgi:predicted nucleotidyltransferase